MSPGSSDSSSDSLSDSLTGSSSDSSSGSSSRFGAWSGLRLAVAFLTRIPVGGFPPSEVAWRWCAAWLPAVGFGIGGVCAAAFWFTTRAGDLVAAGVAVTVGLLLTGAFHEDGLADSADALGGAYDREKLFVILKDSRIGSFGAAALGMALLLRVVLLARLGPWAPAALVVVHGWSRVPPVWLMGILPYVTGEDDSKGRRVAQGGWPQGLWATTTGALGLLAAVRLTMLPWQGLVLLPVVGLVVAWVCGRRFLARAGGLTGDFLGATQQVADLAMLLTLALLRG